MAYTKPQEKLAAKDLNIACESGCDRALIENWSETFAARTRARRELPSETTRHLAQGLRLRSPRSAHPVPRGTVG